MMSIPRIGWIACLALAAFATGCVPPSPHQTSSTTTVGAYSPIGEPYPLAPGPGDRIAPVDLPPDLDDTPAPMQMPSQVAASETPRAEPVEATPLETVAVNIALPSPVFRGTPVPANEPFVEPPRGAPRPPFFAPAGTVNLARGRPVTSSDAAPLQGELDLVVDGDKEATDYGCLTLRPSSEWVQIDLGAPATIYAVVVWHNHAEGRVYRDVIVQVSDDPDFLSAETLFNNDYDNSSGLGIGADLGYVETSEGRLIDCRGVVGRYVRLYSRGNHLDINNHYTEVEVYGTM